MKCLYRMRPGLVSFLFVAAAVTSAHAVGESAVITLVFPPGARATGLGEAFVAVSDDINATFFNPAGLGLTPLAHAWKSYLEKSGYTLTAIASKRKTEFGAEEKIWVGTQKGVIRFSGSLWETYESYLVVQEDDIEKITRKYLDTDDDNAVRLAIKEIKRANAIETQREFAVERILERELPDSLLVQRGQEAGLRAECTERIMALAKFERTPAQVYGVLAEKIDSTRIDTVSAEIVAALEQKDAEFDDMFEIKIPFTIAVRDSVTAMAVDESDALWAGTRSGLWRYDGKTWKKYTVVDGLPSNTITCLAAGRHGRLAVGTDNGAAVYSGTQWSKITVNDGLPDTMVTAVAISPTGVLYAGTNHGLLEKADSSSEFYDTSKGLQSNEVTAILFDSQNRLWTGGINGIAIKDAATWKRYRFPDSRIFSFTEQNAKKVWIGTDRGAISYKEGASKVNPKTQKSEPVLEWKAFHSKNALKGDRVCGLSVHGNDVWMVTEEAVNHYDCGEKQTQFFYEPILPAFKLPDLWHTYLALSFPTDEWGTFAFAVNFLNFGLNELIDELGRTIKSFRSYETVFFFCYGFPLTESLSLGMNFKFVYSALAPGYGPGGEGIGITFAIDAAVLKKGLFLKNLDVGLHLQNMGPAIYYVDPAFKDPIPFNVKAGIAYQILSDNVYNLKYLLDFNREIVKNYGDKPPAAFYEAPFVALTDDGWKREVQDVIVNTGLEFWYARFLALRSGFLFDWVGERYELTFGLGLRYGNMNFDWSYIFSPEGFLKKTIQSMAKDETKVGSHGARDGQWRASFIFRF
jgi:hypothetical protein